MESLTPDKGIFIYSNNLESSFMLKSILSLLDIQPGTRIAGFYNDKVHKGFRVYFEERKSTAVLQKKYLHMSEEWVRLYPLNSFLTIHDIFMSVNDSSQAVLRHEIENNFGTILSLSPAPESPPSFLNRKWRVEIAVPEFSTLNVFERNGYPEMFIKLPNKTRSFKITFWCRFCENDGHTLQECLQKEQIPKHQEKVIALKDYQNNIEMMPRPNPKQNSSQRNSISSPRVNLLESTESFARKIGREEIMKAGIIDEENELSDREFDKGKMAGTSSSQMIDNYNSNRNTLMKENVANKSQNSEQIKSLEANRQNFHELKMNQGDGITIKNEPTSEGLENENTSPTPKGGNNAMSSDDDIQVMDVIETKTSSRETKVSDSKPNMMSGSTESRDTSENSSNQVIKKEAPEASSYSSNIPGTSSQLTSSLSERLQDCFRKAYEDFNVLDARQLDAFLIHVKKKSTPIRVAGNYTKNAAGLKDQLKQILYYYYNTPQTGTKEDIQFVKWLNGLVERFDGTISKKRKRSNKSDDGSARKKHADGESGIGKIISKTLNMYAPAATGQVNSESQSPMGFVSRISNWLNLYLHNSELT